MSKTLRRPMFKMGGQPDSGIVSGFERTNFVGGGTEMKDIIDDLYTQQESMFATAPEYTQPGFGLSEYLALAKLGANIASAPNRGGGIKGFAASTGPAFGQFAEDLDVLNREKLKNRSAFDAAARDAKLKTQGTAAALRGEAVIEGMRQEGDLEQIRLEAETKVFALDNAFDKYDVALNKYNQNSLAISELSTQDLSQEQFDQKLSELKRNETLHIMEMYAALDLKMPQEQELGDLTITGINETAKNNTLSLLNLVEVPTAGDDNYEEYSRRLLEETKRLLNQQRELLKVQTGLDTPDPKRIQEADGGRIGYAMGTDPYQERYREKELDPGPMEPGGLPDDPNAPPIMQASASPSPLAYEELRARLPQEVTNEVVKLLSTSEEALLDFAQIQTQEDIARFNQKYNADLSLPAQTQAV